MALTPERLRALPLFEGLSDDDLARLARAFEAKQVSPGARLTLEGASGYSFFVIESGTVEVTRGGRHPGDVPRRRPTSSARPRS